MSACLGSASGCWDPKEGWKELMIPLRDTVTRVADVGALRSIASVLG
jgi:hypothetical protein